jgi:hypothetical protein
MLPLVSAITGGKFALRPLLVVALRAALVVCVAFVAALLLLLRLPLLCLLQQQAEVLLGRPIAGQTQLGRRDSLLGALQPGLLQDVVDRRIDGQPPHFQLVPWRPFAQQPHAPLRVSAPNVNHLVQHYESPMPYVPLLQEGWIVVQPSKVIHGHRTKTWPLHGDERHNLMGHVTHLPCR